MTVVGGCPSGKRSFSSKAEAHREAKKVRRHRSVRLRPYDCPLCAWWHLTSQKLNSGAHRSFSSLELGGGGGGGGVPSRSALAPRENVPGEPGDVSITIDGGSDERRC
jgi:hypothetical protein